jgi:hypothetical protein
MGRRIRRLGLETRWLGLDGRRAPLVGVVRRLGR